MTREEAIEIVKSAFSAWESEFRVPNDDWSEEHEALDMAIEALEADRPRGEWINKDVMLNEDNPIDEWQEAQCSICEKWHTAPYAYYFQKYNYCPNCGAKMNGERSEE